jgi:hypothetical protein
MADDESAQDSTAAAYDANSARLLQFPEHQHRFDEAIRVLIEQGRRGLVRRIFRILDQSRFHEALQTLNDVDDELRSHINVTVRDLLRAGYDEDETFHVFPTMVVMAAREAAGFRDNDDEPPQPAYGSGGFGAAAVPVPVAAMVASLEKRTFVHAAAAEGCGRGVSTECSICLDGFVDGGEVSVMPCPSRGHEFHTGCIARWLGISNVCPLCRHGLVISSATAAAAMIVAAPPEESSMATQDGPTPPATTVVDRRRSSTRQRRPNTRTSGPEWVWP